MAKQPLAIWFENEYHYSGLCKTCLNMMICPNGRGARLYTFCPYCGVAFSETVLITTKYQNKNAGRKRDFYDSSTALKQRLYPLEFLIESKTTWLDDDDWEPSHIYGYEHRDPASVLEHLGREISFGGKYMYFRIVYRPDGGNWKPVGRIYQGMAK